MARGGVDKRGEAWRARYRHPETGKQHQRTFARQVDAQRWLRDQLGTIDSGRWVDPQAGRLTFVAYYTEWSRRQVWEEGTRLAMFLAVRSTTFADLELRRVRTSHVEQWVKHMSTSLAASTIKTRFVKVRSVFRAAVRHTLSSRWTRPRVSGSPAGANETQRCGSPHRSR